MKKRIEINNNVFWAHANKTLFWEELDALIISDLHLGKASHFQKSGLPIPAILGHEDLNQIAKIIFDQNPSQVIFLGDLFHSKQNEEWSWFIKWMDHFPKVKFTLVEGNHDRSIISILPKNLKATDLLEHQGVLLTHEPLSKIEKDKFNIAGHIHPGAILKGRGRQSIKLPCFWKVKNQLIMPAFGNLTGAVKMPAKKADVYAVFEDEIFRV